MDQSERARLRALCEAATPGPWECNGVSIDPEDGYVFARQGANIRGTLIVLDDTYERCGSDMLLLAASRTAIPALLDDSERLDAVTRERDEARAEAARLRAAAQDLLDADADVPLGETVSVEAVNRHARKVLARKALVALLARDP